MVLKVLYVHATEKYNTVPEQIIYCYRSLTGRRPSQKEMNILEKLYATQYENFKAEPGKTKGWLNAGQYKLKGKNDFNGLAAGAVVASAIMNSDAFITKR